jgi:hypothetical protein
MRAIVVAILLAAASAASADPCTPKLTGKVGLTFKPSHSVAELATWLTSMTCRPVRIAKDVPASALKVTILAPKRYTPKAAVALVTKAIRATGLVVTEKADAFDVVLGPDLPKHCATSARP